MRLRATVRNATGSTVHLQGAQLAGGFKVTTIAFPDTVEVVEQTGAVYLLRINQEGECIADTWRESVEAAKAQAYFEYGVEESEWNDVESLQPH